MANPEHLAILKQSVTLWNAWRKTYKFVTPDLSGEDLTGIQLPHANLSGVNLRRSTLTRGHLYQANLSNSNLYQVEFYRADLSLATLCDSDLSGAKFHNTDLSGATLEGANLFRVDFILTNLTDTAFSSARCGLTTFANVDLSQAKGLQNVAHDGPSNIDVFTLLRSIKEVSPEFLKGTGIQEDFLAYVRGFRPQSLAFVSCFISYSTADQEFASMLHSDLERSGVRCWFAPHDIRGGKKIHEQINGAILAYDRLLLILSGASMNSEWVNTEIANARQREIQEKRQMLFPISVVPYDRIREWKAPDADTGKDSAREIREYFIPDFSNWKDHDSYQRAFQRLLRDLKEEGRRSV